MVIDLGLVVQEAFTILREDAKEISNVSLRVKGQKIKVEEMVRLLLQHLMEIDLIDVHMERLAQKSWEQAGSMATPATLALPDNRIERLGLELELLSPDEITQLVAFMKRPIRQKLAERFQE